MSIVQVLFMAALLFLVWVCGVSIGYMAGERAARKNIQRLLDAWASDTGSQRIRIILDADGDSHDR